MCLGTQRRQRTVAAVIGGPVLAPLEPALDQTLTNLKNNNPSTSSSSVVPLMPEATVSSSSSSSPKTTSSTTVQPPLVTSSSSSPSSSNNNNNNHHHHHAHHHAHHHHAHLIVHHSYHDHSHDRKCDYQEEHPARGGVSTPFPLKLHEMLDAVEGNHHDHIVSWQPHGRCFVVHKPREFVELLPTYFKLSKLASFQRQLNLYGFQRLTRGRDRGAYYHELFLRGRMFMAHSIQRMKVKGTGVRARANPDTEPDFWSMEWIQPMSVEEQQRQQQQQQSQQQQQNLTMQPNMIMSGGMTNLPTSNVTSSYYDTRVLPSSFTTIRNSGNNNSNVYYYSNNNSSMSSPYQQPMSSITSLPPLPTKTSSNSQDENDDDDDIVCAFGNKTFHYLDPFQQQLPRSTHQQSQQQQQPLKSSSYDTKKPASTSMTSSYNSSWYTTPQPYPQPFPPQQSQSSNQQQRNNEEEVVEQDALLSTEAESFFQDFDFSPIIDAVTNAAAANPTASTSTTSWDGGIENDDVFGEMLESLIA